MQKDKELFFLGKVFLLSYLLNFLWESIHAYLFYAGHQDYSLGFYFRMVGYAAFMDGLLILLLYLIVAFFLREFLWKRKEGYALFFFLGLILAAGIEYHAVYLAGKWSYNAFMPTLFGIGVSPLLQLSVTGLCTLFLLRKQEQYGHQH